MIYYVEDDENIRNLAVYTLEQAGLAARGFAHSDALFTACEELLPDLFLLDIMLPDDDGITILKRLRAQRSTQDIPIMMLTAKGTEFDTVTGLDAGADDYLSKPFGMMELVSRVNALLRRSARMSPEKPDVVEAGAVSLCSSRHSVTVDGEDVCLTFKEFELLRFLLENQGLVFSREQLLESLWGWTYDGGTRTVDVHIQTLRQKLGDCANIIETVRGIGYRAKA